MAFFHNLNHPKIFNILRNIRRCEVGVMSYESVYTTDYIKKILKDAGIPNEDITAIIEITELATKYNPYKLMVSGYPTTILIKGQTNEW